MGKVNHITYSMKQDPPFIGQCLKALTGHCDPELPIKPNGRQSSIREVLLCLTHQQEPSTSRCHGRQVHGQNSTRILPDCLQVFLCFSRQQERRSSHSSRREMGHA